MGLGEVGWDEMVLYCGGDGACGGDGGFSLMMVVETVVSGLGSSVMLITVWEAQETSLVRGKTKDIGCGFKIFIGEILVRGFLIEGSPMKEATRMSLKYLLDNTDWSGICRNKGNALFLCSKGSTSSSYSEYVCIWTFGFFVVGENLVLIASSCPFFFRISTSKR
jgi:hypothetical protein